MRLLKCTDGNSIRLTGDLLPGKIPRYAMLSHTWGPDTDEVTCKDILEGTGTDKAGYKKIQFCAEQAMRDGLEHFWVDTCCIDKSNQVEVQKSINSMFRWYQGATRCYVYLSDVSVSPKGEQDGGETKNPAALYASRWFTRGWTLQELLAPATVEFFTREGQTLGDKLSLAQTIHEITGIPIQALCDNRLSRFDIEERFRWAEKRETTHEEDWAYCLLGIFGVYMLPNYGEGKTNAVRRLRMEIERDSKDSECLRELFVVDPRDDIERIEREKGTLFHEAYEWILKTRSFDSFTSWGESDSRPCRLLWIKGPAGTGKTMLMIGIIRELPGRFPVRTPSLSYFFCQGTGTKKLNSVTAAIRSLMWMLLRQQSQLMSHLQDAYKHSGAKLFEGKNEFDALRRIFLNMLRDKDLSPVYFVVDALDEFDRTDPGLAELLQVIATSLAVSNSVKWLVSSRPEVDVLAKVKLSLNDDILDTSDSSRAGC